MDGSMNVIPDNKAEEHARQIAALLAAEWELIQRVRNPTLRRALTVAHGRLHYYARDVAAELGVAAPEALVMSGGESKPPRPQIP